MGLRVIISCVYSLHVGLFPLSVHLIDCLPVIRIRQIFVYIFSRFFAISSKQVLLYNLWFLLLLLWDCIAECGTFWLLYIRGILFSGFKMMKNCKVTTAYQFLCYIQIIRRLFVLWLFSLSRIWNYNNKGNKLSFLRVLYVSFVFWWVCEIFVRFGDSIYNYSFKPFKYTHGITRETKENFL